jgi:hypothetical protein
VTYRFALRKRPSALFVHAVLVAFATQPSPAGSSTTFVWSMGWPAT